MRWVKHMTSSANDEKLSKLRDAFGLEGYGFWWSVVEIVAEKVDENQQTSVTFSAKKWGNLLGISAKKFQTLAEFCANIGIISINNTQNELTVNIHNILKYRDEYTERQARKSGQHPDKLRPSRARSYPDTDTETDKEPPTPCEGETHGAGVEDFLKPEAEAKIPVGTVPIASPVPGMAGVPGAASVPGAPSVSSVPGVSHSWPDMAFCQFIAAYPAVKRNEGKAWAEWQLLKKTGLLPPLTALFDAISAWEGSDQWQKSSGQFVPLASNFLKNSIWLDRPPPNVEEPDTIPGAKGKTDEEIFQQRMAKRARLMADIERREKAAREA